MHPRTRYVAQCLGGATAVWLAPAAARALKRRLVNSAPVPAPLPEAPAVVATPASAPTIAPAPNREHHAVQRPRRPIASKRRVALGLACAGGLVTAPLGGSLVVAGVTSMGPDHNPNRVATVASVADNAPGPAVAAEHDRPSANLVSTADAPAIGALR